MGVDFTAITVVGVHFTREELFEHRRRRTCEHPLPEKAKYCPTCGKKPYESFEVCRIPELDPHTLDFDDEWRSFNVVHDSYKNDYFIGEAVTAGGGLDDYDSMELPDYELERRLQELLQPLGLWDPENYRIYTVQYVSS